YRTYSTDQSRRSRSNVTGVQREHQKSVISLVDIAVNTPRRVFCSPICYRLDLFIREETFLKLLLESLSRKKMGECGVPEAGNWHLRWVLGICIIIGYSYAFFDDLQSMYKGDSMFRASGQRDYILTVLNRAIDDDAQPPRSERVSPAGRQQPTKVDRERCEASLEAERTWQHTQLHHDSWAVFASVEQPVQRVFVVLDLLMIVFGCLAGIVGYLLIHGAVWKRRKHLVPWLLLSFTIAYGPVFYGGVHIAIKQGLHVSSANSLNIGFIVAFAIIVVVLHATAFYAVTKFFLYLWKPEDEITVKETLIGPESIRKNKLENIDHGIWDRSPNNRPEVRKTLRHKIIYVFP
ncbi:Protein of unknown function, partial [Gryllus bimaculatus]